MSGAKPPPDRDAAQPPSKEHQRAFDDGIQVVRLGLRGGKLRQGRELVYQLPHGLDRAQDHLTAFADNTRRLRHRMVDMLANSLRRQADRRERILDLVGHALRNFFPRDLALGAQEFGHVFDDQDAAPLVPA